YAPDRQAADAVLAEGAVQLGQNEFDDEQRRGRSDPFDSFLLLADDLFATVEREPKETHV
ncbi:MAG TPA: hypothetical protein VHN36_06455, partial [Ilumatobacteraceae bacterium]|nr:hypothetical protein [Ilumatobacteraceae bacterium]